MIAIKGFTMDLTSCMGDGREENCRFVPRETKEVPESKTARNGFHCCEYAFDCLSYYPLRTSRFFKVEASGDIDEDNRGRIACTRITLMEELSTAGLALEAMRYMVNHPQREGWKINTVDVMVSSDQAEAERAGSIAIARGEDPKVRGPVGSIVGLIVESGEGITRCKLGKVTAEQEGKWLHLTEDRRFEITEPCANGPKDCPFETSNENKSESRDEVFRRCICEYGDQPEIDMCIEEMSELTKALLKWRRFQSMETGKKVNPVSRNKKASGYRADVIDEIADVKIMIRRMEILFMADEEVEHRIDFKVNRQRERLNEIRGGEDEKEEG